jgi:hypothetical protein
MDIETRELNDAELDAVAGGLEKRAQSLADVAQKEQLKLIEASRAY